MTWAKQPYKKKKSQSRDILKRIERKKEMSKRSGSKKESKPHHTHEHKKTEELPTDKHFHACNGSAIKSIEELALLIDQMSDAEFSHHVTSEKNDFASWIEHVFNKPELAATVQPLTDKKDSQIALLKHVVSEKK